ncbi:UNVERIFIED_CONTAM: hypothetical protein PYX00_009588 [Menopon gallinae]|uniref:Uncharacterized protein n=1 Tax=Menopon gallinae TaxID=328185 RepID=A0AAW2HCD0_9NEOP
MTHSGTSAYPATDSASRSSGAFSLLFDSGNIQTEEEDVRKIKNFQTNRKTQQHGQFTHQRMDLEEVRKSKVLVHRLIRWTVVIRSTKKGSSPVRREFHGRSAEECGTSGRLPAAEVERLDREIFIKIF